VIENFALAGRYAVLDGSLLRTQFCVIQFPPHSFYTSVYVALLKYMSCACHIRAKITNKEVNFAICWYDEVRAVNKRVKVYPESLLRLSKGYRGNFSEKETRGRALWEFVQEYQIYEC